MSIHNMMYNGISGINTMSDNMGVAANNVANINTVGYKSATPAFYDILSTATGNSYNRAQFTGLNRDFRSGDLETTNRSTDMAINGRGFFMLRDPGEGAEAFYTRDGQFSFTATADAPDGAYFLLTPQGHYLQGLNLGSVETPTDTVEDILIRRESLPQATSALTLAVNLQNNPGAVEQDDAPLFAAWDGVRSPPINDGAFDYSTLMKCYDDQGQAFSVTTYFDYTTNDNEKEFLVTCDPALDQRLIGDTGVRYNAGTTPERGAGALLYGKLIFSSSGELMDIQAWNVPAVYDDLDPFVPDVDNMLEPATADKDYAFAYNISGVGDNLAATLNFGTVSSPQVTNSPGSAKATGAGDTAPAISPLTDWDSVYDLNGNQVRDGDEITFTGLNHDGEAVTLTYVVDYQNRVEDLMQELEEAFAATALLRDGQLELQDNENGASQLAVTSISYRDADGNSPTDNSLLAQFFGADGSAFTVTATDDLGLATIRTTNYATSSADVFKNQDGFGVGYLQNITVNTEGVITGHYSNDQRLEQAQLMLADFPMYYKGLLPIGGNLYKATAEAGAPIIGIAGSDRFGRVINNSLEMSNVDLARQFVDLTMTQRIFQANSMVITTANEVYETALRLK